MRDRILHASFHQQVGQMSRSADGSEKLIKCEWVRQVTATNLSTWKSSILLRNYMYFIAFLLQSLRTFLHWPVNILQTSGPIWNSNSGSKLCGVVRVCDLRPAELVTDFRFFLFNQLSKLQNFNFGNFIHLIQLYRKFWISLWVV